MSMASRAIGNNLLKETVKDLRRKEPQIQPKHILFVRSK